MTTADVRQWWLPTAHPQERAWAERVEAGPVAVGAVSVGAVSVGQVTLVRPGPARRPICGGESVAIALGRFGYLAAGPDPATRPVLVPEPAPEWVVTGVAPGVAVPVDRPVGLFDTVAGDHLVRLPERLPDGAAGTSTRPGPDPAAGLVWACDRCPGGPLRPLPIPDRCRPVEGMPGDAELAGALVAFRDGDPAAGLLLRPDPVDGRALGEHLASRVPELAARLAPEGVPGAVACRRTPAGGPLPADLPLPPPGTRVCAQGYLVADPDLSLAPVRVLAWAQDGTGAALAVRPGDPSWPPTALTWRIVLLPQSAARPHHDGRPQAPASALWLPLPGRDGEPGSTTTVTPLRDAPAEPESRGAGYRIGPALVPGPRGLRMLRFPLRLGPLGVAVRLGCTVRVHLPAPQPTGA